MVSPGSSFCRVPEQEFFSHEKIYLRIPGLNLCMFPPLYSLLCSPKLLLSRYTEPGNFFLSNSGKDCKDNHICVEHVAYCVEPWPSTHNTIYDYFPALYKASTESQLVMPVILALRKQRYKVQDFTFSYRICLNRARDTCTVYKKKKKSKLHLLPQIPILPLLNKVVGNGPDYLIQFLSSLRYASCLNM